MTRMKLARKRPFKGFGWILILGEPLILLSVRAKKRGANTSVGRQKWNEKCQLNDVEVKDGTELGSCSCLFLLSLFVVVMPKPCSRLAFFVYDIFFVLHMSLKNLKTWPGGLCLGSTLTSIKRESIGLYYQKFQN